MRVHTQIVVGYNDGPTSGFMLRDGQWLWFETLATHPARGGLDERFYLVKPMPEGTYDRLDALTGSRTTAAGASVAAGLEVPDDLLIAALHAPAVAVLSMHGGMEASWTPVDEAIKVNTLYIGFAQAATRIVDLMVRKEFDQLAGLLDPEVLPLDEFKAELAECEAVSGPLTPLPPGSIKPDNIMRSDHEADFWSVWVDLWHDREQSDWTLILSFTKEGGRMKVSIEELHVM